jgi:hypothetical protein
MTAVSRRVVLICGPPGAGKTTHARTLGLTVYDLDDPQWAGSERTFREAIHRLAFDATAQAAVIRSGATLSARAKTHALIGATEVQVITTDPDTCIKQIINRKRDHPPLTTQIAAVKTWWDRYQPGGGGSQPPAATRPPAAPRRQHGTTAQRGYGNLHRRTRLAYLAHLRDNPGLPCWRCGQPMYYEDRANLDLGHDDNNRSVYRGLEHAGRCNRSAAATKGNRARGHTEHAHAPRRW